MMNYDALLLVMSELSAHEANGHPPLSRKGKNQGQVAKVFHEDFLWQKTPKDADYEFYGKLEMYGGMFCRILY